MLQRAVLLPALWRGEIQTDRRIEDIEPTAAELRRLVPDLSLLVAHGDMKASEMDEAMVAFANGAADILLSTNIIENGLDVPRANTIVIFRSDRFGLAQLHQLRGRVGRGRAQGHAYLLTEPDKEIAAETRSRLSTLLAFDRLGSGIAISARDLDLRGAGDLVGEDQAGHMKLIGLSLYQRHLALAVDRARGKDRSIQKPSIDLEISGALPSEYVPEPVVRLNSTLACSGSRPWPRSMRSRRNLRIALACRQPKRSRCSISRA